jgi:hypothetical protein
MLMIQNVFIFITFPFYIIFPLFSVHFLNENQQQKEMVKRRKGKLKTMPGFSLFVALLAGWGWKMGDGGYTSDEYILAHFIRFGDFYFIYRNDRVTTPKVSSYSCIKSPLKINFEGDHPKQKCEKNNFENGYNMLIIYSGIPSEFMLLLRGGIFMDSTLNLYSIKDAFKYLCKINE